MFLLVVMDVVPIEHKMRYELSNCYSWLVSNGFDGDKIEDMLSEKKVFIW